MKTLPYLQYMIQFDKKKVIIHVSKNFINADIFPKVSKEEKALQLSIRI